LSIIRKINAKCVVVTTSEHLFDYQDDVENYNIIWHSWAIMRKIGEENKVLVGLTPSSMHMKFAKKYCHKLKVLENGTYSIKPAHYGRYYHK